VIGRCWVQLAVSCLLIETSLAQSLPVQQITADNVDAAWGIKGSPTSAGQILWHDSNDTVWLFNGTSVATVQLTDTGKTVNDNIWMLGSGSATGHVIGGWRRGNGYSDVSVDGGTPVKVDVNPEFVSIIDGCVFFTLQDGTNPGQQVFKVDVTTGVRTLLGTGKTAYNVTASSCSKVAWAWSPTATAPYGIQYWDGTTTTTLDTDAGFQYGINMRRGRMVYTKKVDNIQQVFVVDTNTSLTPVQLSAETDATKYLYPLTDGRHVAWFRCTDNNCNDAQLYVNGGLLFPTGPLGSIDNNRILPFELDGGQLLWANRGGSYEYDDGRHAVRLDPAPATTMELPFLTDGYIAFLGKGGSDGGDDREVFRITGTTPDDTSQPCPPLLVTATPGTGQVTVAWDPILGATSYNLYMANVPGVTKDNYTALAGGRKITGVTTPFTVSSLGKNQYFFAISALEGSAESRTSRVAMAQVGLTWQSVGGFAGTNFFSVAADQGNASIVYAGASGSVYKSLDGGITWPLALSSATTGGGNIVALAVNASNVFANAMPQADIWRSTNAGGAWTRILDVTGFGESFSGSLTLDPVNPTTMYAADFILPGKTSTDSLVIKSTNGGTNWALTPQGPPGDEIHAYALAIDPTNTSIIYGGGSGSPNTFKSVNGGASWTNIPIAGAVGGVYSIAVDPTSPSTVYATTRDAGVFKSFDRGATWTARNIGLPVSPGLGFNSILIDPQNASTLHLGTGNGYYYSYDAGKSWTAANEGFGITPQYIRALTLTPAGRLIAATGDGLYLLGLGPAPVVSGVLPASGAPAGGTLVTITGAGFQPAAAVTFGGAAATNVTIVDSGTITATTPAHAAGSVAVTVTNFDMASGTLPSAFSYLSGPPSAPTGVVASAQTTTSVVVSWSAATTATSYEVFRQAPGIAFTSIGTSSGTSFADATVQANTSYLYRIRAVNAAGASADSAADIATTVIFSDDPLVRGTRVKAAHLSEARTAINAVRQLAGLAAMSFIDAASAGVVVKSRHVTDMRTALDAALGPLGRPVGNYTDASLSGSVIKAVHFQEIRDRVR
jgi:hypothetical protein